MWSKFGLLALFLQCPVVTWSFFCNFPPASKNQSQWGKLDSHHVIHLTTMVISFMTVAKDVNWGIIPLTTTLLFFQSQLYSYVKDYSNYYQHINTKQTDIYNEHCITSSTQLMSGHFATIQNCNILTWGYLWSGSGHSTAHDQMTSSKVFYNWPIFVAVCSIWLCSMKFCQNSAFISMFSPIRNHWFTEETWHLLNKKIVKLGQCRSQLITVMGSVHYDHKSRPTCI